MQKTTDHLGKEYTSKSEMCRMYSVSLQTYNARRVRGLGIAESLGITNATVNVDNIYKDHLGIEYTSLSAMALAYGQQTRVLARRLNAGWDMQAALLTSVSDEVEARSIKSILDHKGREYASVREMCKAWHLPVHEYRARRGKGWSLKDALCTKYAYTGRRTVDHLGRAYVSQKEMCRVWGITADLYINRCKRGWSKIEALTGQR